MPLRPFTWSPFLHSLNKRRDFPFKNENPLVLDMPRFNWPYHTERSACPPMEERIFPFNYHSLILSTDEFNNLTKTQPHDFEQQNRSASSKANLLALGTCSLSVAIDCSVT